MIEIRRTEEYDTWLRRLRDVRSASTWLSGWLRDYEDGAMMAKTKTYPWDPVDYLNTREDMIAYLDAALEDGDPKLIAAVLGDIARAEGMSQIAKETGLRRESLYKALSAEGNPEFATILKVTQALGFRPGTRLLQSKALSGDD